VIPQERRLRVDWKRIKAEYIAGGTSYRKLAEKYEVKLSALRSVAEREKWVELKAQAQHKTDTKIIDTVSDKAADKATKIIDVADKLLLKIEEVAEKVNDPDSIKKLTSAIKDIRDIKGVKSEADLREQEARIAKLQKEAEADEKDNNEIRVTIEGGLDEFSK
jgi:Zn-dependent metalloprotease